VLLCVHWRAWIKTLNCCGEMNEEWNVTENENREILVKMWFPKTNSLKVWYKWRCPRQRGWWCLYVWLKRCIPAWCESYRCPESHRQLHSHYNPALDTPPETGADRKKEISKCIKNYKTWLYRFVKLIKPPLQKRLIGKFYTLSAVCIEQIKQK